MKRRIRKTKMTDEIIAYANEQGYFPTLEQAHTIWGHLNVIWSQRLLEGHSNRITPEAHAETMNEALRRFYESQPKVTQ